MSAVLLHAWDDHPDRQDHRENDRLFRDIQDSTGVRDYDNSPDHDSVAPERDGREFSSRARDNDNGFGVPDRDK